MKTRYIAQGQQLLRADREVETPLHPKLVERMLRIAREHDHRDERDGAVGLRQGHAGWGYPRAADRGGAPDRAAGGGGIRRGRIFPAMPAADVITPNRRELSIAVGRKLNGEADLIAAATELRTAHGFGAVLVTRAEDGIDAGGQARDDPFSRPRRPRCFDVSGAGDTVVAALAAGMAAGLDLRIAVRLANIAAGVVVAKVGYPRWRARPIWWRLCRPRVARCGKSFPPRRPASSSSGGGGRIGGSGSPMAVSICCIPAMCICSSRRGRIATG